MRYCYCWEGLRAALVTVLATVEGVVNGAGEPWAPTTSAGVHRVPRAAADLVVVGRLQSTSCAQWGSHTIVLLVYRTFRSSSPSRADRAQV